MQGLIHVDIALKQLPTPAAPRGRKAALLAELRDVTTQETVPSQPMTLPELPALHVEPLPPRPRERFWLRFGIGLTTAASLLIALTWLGVRWQRSTPEPQLVLQPTDEWLQGLMQRHVALCGKSANAVDRLNQLNQLATDLRQQTEQLAQIASDDDMKTLARLYGKVVDQGVLQQAALVRKQPQAILEPIRRELEQAALATGQLAQRVKPGSAEPLRQMAEVSRKGDQRLRLLLREAAS